MVLVRKRSDGKARSGKQACEKKLAAYFKNTHIYNITPIREFIDSLPFFEQIGQALFWYDEYGGEVLGHVDHQQPCIDEFVWICPIGYKKLYVLDENKNRIYIPDNSRCVWFNSSGQVHGIEKTGDFSISLRIDGIFKREFKSLIDISMTASCKNKACTKRILCSEES